MRRIFAAAATLLFALTARAEEAGIKVRVGLGDVSLNKLIFVVAAEAGIYRRNGLEVQQFISPRAAEVVRRSGVVVPPEFVRNEAGDINIGGGSPMMVDMTTNALSVERVVLATTDPVSRFRIVVARSDLASPQDLKGKRIGYSVYGALSHLSAIVFAKAMGWDPERDVSLMSNGMSLQALSLGRIDAMVGDEVAWTAARAVNFRELVDLAPLKIPMPGSGVNAERRWLAANPDAAQRFIKATVEAIALAKTDKALAEKAMAKWYGIADPAQAALILAQLDQLPRKPYPAVDGIRKVMEVYGYHEMRRHAPEDFYDASFVAALDKSGYIDRLYSDAQR